MFYNSIPVDKYNMLVPHGNIRVELDVVEHDRVEHDKFEHDRVYEMINDTFWIQGGMEYEQYFDEAPYEEARCFYDVLRLD